mmetsp:Transcript_18653/g.27899  ORF Transcript_18653/g.27899 Transcript_18653/m.27899 type:complete len:476 (-) Transcript_18653:775-2202(-)
MSRFPVNVLIHKIISSFVLGVGGVLVIIGSVIVIRNRNHIVVRSRGLASILVSAVMLFIWMLLQVTRVWEVLAPCVLIFFIVQIIIATISTVIFYRTYSIIHRLANQQKAQSIMLYLNSEGRRSNAVMERQSFQSAKRGKLMNSQKSNTTDSKRDVEAAPPLEEEEEFLENCCIRNADIVKKRNRIIFAIIQFIFIMILFIANPRNYEAGSLSSCYAESSLHAAALNLVLFVVLVIGFRFLEGSDSFNMITEISLCAAGIIMCVVLFVVIFASSDHINSQDQRDLEIDNVILLELLLSIFLVLMPAIWSSKQSDNGDDTRLKPNLVRILAHRESLELFQKHLIKEWSVENLLFYQDITKVQLRAGSLTPKLVIQRLDRVYVKYVGKDATFEVNLSALNKDALHSFFRSSQVKRILLLTNHRGSSGQNVRSNKNRRKKSDGDFIEAVELADKKFKKSDKQIDMAASFADLVSQLES